MQVLTLGWSPDGRKLASGSADHTVRLWQPFTQQKELCVLSGHTDTIEHLAWNPKNPEQLATASTDKTVKIWDARCMCVLCHVRLLCCPLGSGDPPDRCADDPLHTAASLPQQLRSAPTQSAHQGRTSTSGGARAGTTLHTGTRTMSSAWWIRGRGASKSGRRTSRTRYRGARLKSSSR